MDYTYFYHGFLYRWERSKADLTYRDDHIKLLHAVQAIWSCIEPEEQGRRWKYIGASDVGIITVITEEDECRIVTAWKASKTEQQHYLMQRR